MKAFVTGRRAPSPSQTQRPASANSMRRAVAESARVPVPVTTIPQRPNSTLSLRTGQRPPNKTSGNTGWTHSEAPQHANAFDTDLEESTTNISEVGTDTGLKNTHFTSQGVRYGNFGHAPSQKDGYDDGEGDDGDGDESEGTEDPRDGFNRENPPMTNEEALQFKRELFGSQIPGIFDVDDSYPTTTSGGVDDRESSEVAEDQAGQTLPFHPFADSPVKPPFTYTQSRQVPLNDQPTTLPSSSVPARQNGIYSQYQPPTRPVVTQASLTRNQQQDSSDETSRRHEPAVAPSYPKKPFPPTSASTFRRAAENRMNVPAQQPSYPPTNQPSVAPVSGSGVPPQAFGPAVDAQVLDYSENELYSKAYSDLQEESYDFDPAVETPFAHPDLAPTVALESRLEYALQNLGSEDQAKLFNSLSFDDWENAGDWFLGRFGDFVKRIAESRKQKRALAREFEDEITQRNEDVASKRQKVDDVLAGMRMGGEGLLRTPRKTPRKTPGRTLH